MAWLSWLTFFRGSRGWHELGVDDVAEQRCPSVGARAVETHIFRPKSEDPYELVASVRDHCGPPRAEGTGQRDPQSSPTGDREQAGDLDLSVQVVQSRIAAEGPGRPQGGATWSRGTRDQGETVAVESGLDEAAHEGIRPPGFPCGRWDRAAQGQVQLHREPGRHEEEVELNVANGFVRCNRARAATWTGRQPGDERIDHRPLGGAPAGARRLSDSAGMRRRRLSGPSPAGPGWSRMRAPIRVGQNKGLPQYGLIRANSADAPGLSRDRTWVVHWRIGPPAAP